MGFTHVEASCIGAFKWINEPRDFGVSCRLRLHRREGCEESIVHGDEEAFSPSAKNWHFECELRHEAFLSRGAIVRAPGVVRGEFPRLKVPSEGRTNRFSGHIDCLNLERREVYCIIIFIQQRQKKINLADLLYPSTMLTGDL